MTAWAFIVGINTYPDVSKLNPLHGAVADAAAFAEWALDPNGGGVLPEHLFLWTCPAPPAHAGGALAHFMAAPTTWPIVNADVWNSDPHKGAFGGSPSCRGATLSLASFQQTEGIEFLALHLEVRVDPRAEPLTGPVTFYLHPTFSPSTQQIAPISEMASFTCYAWGGFTLGAETSDGRRMELDLAALDALPIWFRTR